MSSKSAASTPHPAEAMLESYERDLKNFRLLKFGTAMLTLSAIVGMLVFAGVRL